MSELSTLFICEFKVQAQLETEITRYCGVISRLFNVNWGLEFQGCRISSTKNKHKKSFDLPAHPLTKDLLKNQEVSLSN